MIRFNGGRGWEYDCAGRITLERETEPARTRGEPKTMRLMLSDFGVQIYEAHEMFPQVSLPTICAVISLEAARIRPGLHLNPHSFRQEKNDYSSGLMQTLSGTAKQMSKKYTLPVPYIDRESLTIPRVSILCGVAYLHDRAKRYRTLDGMHKFGSTDGMLLQAAYNAGGLYKSQKNEWKIKTHGDDRTERFAQWHNDALAVLGER